MTEPDDDLTIDIKLRPIEDVAHRMVILAGLIEIALTLSDPDDDRPLEQSDQELIDLADSLLIGEPAEYLSGRERSLLASNLSTLDDDALSEMLWDVEALNVLNWATSLSSYAEIPPPWQQADATRLVGSIPPPWDEIGQFVSTLQFRPEIAIAAAREAAELWVWRGAVDDELRTARGFDRAEFLTAIRETAQEAEDAGLIDSADGDFLADRVAFPRATDEIKSVIVQIALQRLRALNWLCGFGASWDDVPLDI
jgi:hypothetical protein